jgi:orotidine-5'-phosphate decarboxylase
MDSDIATPTASLGHHSVRAAERLVVALDFNDVRLADRLVSELGDTVSCYKVGYHLQLISGYDELVDKLIERGKRVLLDTKVCDISETVRAAVAGAVKRRASFLTIHGNGDVTDAALEAAAEARRGTNLSILLVTVLTSMDDLDLHVTGYRASVMDEALRRAHRALQFGLDGVICSGYEAAAIRQMAGTPNFIIATPGIRPHGMPRGDQKRVMTPADAISNSADYLIVGRPIIQAREPRVAAASIIAEMQSAFDHR